jgi:hypothetical protein
LNKLEDYFLSLLSYNIANIYILLFTSISCCEVFMMKNDNFNKEILSKQISLEDCLTCYKIQLPDSACNYVGYKIEQDGAITAYYTRNPSVSAYHVIKEVPILLPFEPSKVYLEKLNFPLISISGLLNPSLLYETKILDPKKEGKSKKKFSIESLLKD